MILADPTSSEVLKRAIAFGFDIHLEGGRIIVRAPGHVPLCLTEYIRAHRGEIVAQLEQLPGCYS